MRPNERAESSSVHKGGDRMAIDVKSGDLLTTEELGQHLAIYAGPGAGKTHFWSIM